MVDQKKVILMTRLAIYEKKQEKKDLVLSKYYKSDYVKYQGLKTLVASTLAYWLTVAVIIFMQFEVILDKINDIDYFGAVYSLMIGYAIFVLLNFIFCYMVYSYRYTTAKTGLITYNKQLKELINYYSDSTKKSNDYNSVVEDFDDEVDNIIEERVLPKNNNQTRVNKTAMLNQKEKEVQEEKARIIKENLRRLREKEELNQKLEAQRMIKPNKLSNNIHNEDVGLDKAERRN